MLIGHFGVALALKKAEPKINVGWLCLASLWLDILVWTFALLGIERIIIPQNYDQLHYLEFVFPYSHSLVAGIVWTAVAFGVGRWIWRGRADSRAGLIMAAAMASHYVLDLLVHPLDMPVAGATSYHMGLGLWNYLSIALAIEGALLAMGLWMYYRATDGRTRTGTYGPLILMIVIGVMALAGQAISPTPPNTMIVAVQGLVIILLLSGLLGWFDTKRQIA